MKIARFSRLGFILAATGSAVGLGNIWKFPYQAGKYGGGAFVLIYLITVVMIGFTVMIAEMLMGYLGRKDTFSNFEDLAPKNKKMWRLGGLQGFSSLVIMIFYSVVTAWVLNYIVTSFMTLPSSVPEAKAAFTGMLHSGFWTQLFYLTISFLIVTVVVARGIKGGIEKLNLVLMPLLFIIIGGMFFYAISFGAFSQALDFMFRPDFSKLTPTAFVTAVGHAFFTLSLGMGAIMTYSASLEKGQSLVKSSLIIIFLDTLIAILAGLMLFTFLYQYGGKPSSGPGLVFISLPATFYKMGALGNFLSISFFIALAFAAISSAVSLVEPAVQYMMDRYGQSRLKATILMNLSYYLLGIVTILSQLDGFSSFLTWGGKTFFGWLDFLSAAFFLPIGGLAIAIFVGYVMPKTQIEKVLRPQLGNTIFNLWYWNLRYIVPVALIIVMVYLVKSV
jgi:neurotransmitter:Na+ symporter, NSS family